MKAMILAAGYGTRLRPVTYTMPKPMVPLCNRPLIAWAMESVLAAGADEVIVNVHHLPEQLESYLRSEFGDRTSLHISMEEEILGTGGGIRRVRHLLEPGEEFLLVNGDTIQFPPWKELLDARRTNDALAALTLRHPPAGDRFTPVHFQDGRVTGFGKGEGEPLMFAGSHVISSRVFHHLPAKEFSGIVEHVYQPMLDSRREIIAGVVHDGIWFDIGTPQRYITASEALCAAMVAGELEPPSGSRIDGTSLVHESSRGSAEGSTIGERSVVDGDVKNSVIWSDCAIAVDVTLERCVVGHGVRLTSGSWRDALIVNDDPAIPPGTERTEGLVVTSI